MEKKNKYKDKNDEITFNLVDESTIKRLQRNGEVTLPRKKVDVPKDEQWNTKTLNSKLLQTILNGDSLDKFEKDLVSVIGNNAASLQRNARTMVTGAECGGRVDSYKELEEMGVIQKKVWLSCADDRTRASHLEIDGEEVDINETFSNGLMYPGDPSGEPEEVWNCRCTIRDHIIGFKRKDGSISYVKDDDVKTRHDKEVEEERERRESVEEKDKNGNKVQEELTPANNLDKVGQIDIDKSKDKRTQQIELIKEYSGFGQEEAERVMDALYNENGEGYFRHFDSQIRSATSGKFKEDAEIIQNYIDASPKYDGTIYRGIAIPKNQLSNFVTGTIFDESKFNISSWTSKFNVAAEFSEKNKSKDSRMVVFKLEETTHGTPVKHLSVYGFENEVLVNNKDVKYEIIGKDIQEVSGEYGRMNNVYVIKIKEVE